MVLLSLGDGDWVLEGLRQLEVVDQSTSEEGSPQGKCSGNLYEVLLSICCTLGHSAMREILQVQANWGVLSRIIPEFIQSREIFKLHPQSGSL